MIFKELKLDSRNRISLGKFPSDITGFTILSIDEGKIVLGINRKKDATPVASQPTTPEKPTENSQYDQGIVNQIYEYLPVQHEQYTLVLQESDYTHFPMKFRHWLEKYLPPTIDLRFEEPEDGRTMHNDLQESDHDYVWGFMNDIRSLYEKDAGIRLPEPPQNLLL